MASAALERLFAEIAEQPEVIARVLEQHRDTARRLGPLLSKASAVVLVARGSSDHAAVYGRYLFETRNRLLTSLAAPSTVTLYGAGPRLAGTVVIAVSQSGQGSDVVAYVNEARRQGAVTVALVNDARSPLASAVEHVIDIAAGPEVSVPATKTVIAQMAVFALLSFELANEPPDAPFAALVAATAQAITRRPDARPLAQALAKAVAISVIGRGLAYPVALELALKLKETSDTRAEPFSAADFRHGPIALIDPDHPALLVDVGGRTRAPAEETIALARERGAPAFLLRTGGPGPALAVPTLELTTDVHDALTPLLGVVLGQQLAVELALAKGMDPAQPAGLTKVTSTH